MRACACAMLLAGPMTAIGADYVAQAHYVAHSDYYGMGGALIHDLTGDGLPEVAFTNATGLEIRDPRQAYRLLDLLSVEGAEISRLFPLDPAPSGGSFVSVSTTNRRVSVWGEWPLRVLREFSDPGLAGLGDIAVGQFDGDPAMELAYCSNTQLILVVLDLDSGQQTPTAAVSQCEQLLPVQVDADAQPEFLVVHQYSAAEVVDVATASVIMTSPSTLPMPVAAGNIDSDPLSELVIGYPNANRLTRVEMPTWSQTELTGSRPLDQGTTAMWLWDPQRDGRHDWLVVQDGGLSLFSPSAGIAGPAMNASGVCRGAAVIAQLDGDALLEALCTNGLYLHTLNEKRVEVTELGSGRIEWSIGSAFTGSSPAVVADFDGDGNATVAIIENQSYNGPTSRLKLLHPVSLEEISSTDLLTFPASTRFGFSALAATDSSLAPGVELAAAASVEGTSVLALLQPGNPEPLWVNVSGGDTPARLIAVEISGDAFSEIAMLSAYTASPRRCGVRMHASQSGAELWRRDLGVAGNRAGQQLLAVDTDGVAPDELVAACAGRVSLLNSVTGTVIWSRDVLAAEVAVDAQTTPSSLVASGSSGSTRLALSDGATLATWPGKAQALLLTDGPADAIVRRNDGILRLDLRFNSALTATTPLGAHRGETLDILPAPNATGVYVNNGNGVSRLTGPGPVNLFRAGFE